jgi:hypothetical protein
MVEQQSTPIIIETHEHKGDFKEWECKKLKLQIRSGSLGQ